VPVLDPLTDPRRLTALRELAILDTPAEADYDDLAALAAALLRSPAAAVNFVDDARHFTKAVVGMPEARGVSVDNDASFCAVTVARPDGVLVVPDTSVDERWREHPLVAEGPRVGFYAGASITSAGQRVGVVAAFGPQPRQVSDAERAALVMLARQVESQLELRRRNAELRDLAVRDPLTGLANRTLLFDRLEVALAARARGGGEVGVLFCDVDDLKRVNDRHGHAAGDRVLRTVAHRLCELTRAADTVARIAGDEFVVVAPAVSGEDELEGLAARVAAPHSERVASLLSVGAVLARDGEHATDVLRRADAAMYAAKAVRRAKSPLGARAGA